MTDTLYVLEYGDGRQNQAWQSVLVSRRAGYTAIFPDVEQKINNLLLPQGLYYPAPERDGPTVHLIFLNSHCFKSNDGLAFMLGHELGHYIDNTDDQGRSSARSWLLARFQSCGLSEEEFNRSVGPLLVGNVHVMADVWGFTLLKQAGYDVKRAANGVFPKWLRALDWIKRKVTKKPSGCTVEFGCSTGSSHPSDLERNENIARLLMLTVATDEQARTKVDNKTVGGDDPATVVRRLYSWVLIPLENTKLYQLASDEQYQAGLQAHRADFTDELYQRLVDLRQTFTDFRAGKRTREQGFWDNFPLTYTQNHIELDWPNVGQGRGSDSRVLVPVSTTGHFRGTAKMAWNVELKKNQNGRWQICNLYFGTINLLKTSQDFLERSRSNVPHSQPNSLTLRWRNQASKRCVRRVAISSNGLLATGSEDGSVTIWDISTGKRKRAVSGHNYEIVGLKFLPNGEILVSGSSEGAVLLWSMKTGKVIRTIQTGDILNDFETSSDGRLLFSAGTPSASNHSGAVRVWNLGTGKLLRDVKISADFGVQHLALSPDGKLMAAQDSEGLRVIDVSSGKQLSCTEYSPMDMAFSPDSKALLAVGDTYGKGTLALDVTTGRRLPVDSWPTSGWGKAVAFSPSGRFVVSIWADRSVKLFPLWGPPFYILGMDPYSLAISPNGQHLALGGWDGSLHVYAMDF